VFQFYDELTTEELYQICHEQLDDVEKILAAILEWIGLHPDLVDPSL
jgi:hypothetical protein